ncbi:hypothetical protein AB3331_09480 [Streptococcus sp. H49]|uniref:hypothetical protein n=1 Tax=Streptococcus huangxiaojuni TaxID=3237239 RepID=UPI0034A1688F
MLTKEKCEELGVSQFVKRPIPAYAIQLIDENVELLQQEERLDFEGRTIQTLEGQFEFAYGDYLVVGNEGEVWSVKQSIFEGTYKRL